MFYRIISLISNRNFTPMYRLFAFLLLFISATVLGQVDFKKLDAYYAQAVKDWDVPGMSIAIVKDGKVVFARSYGTKEVGKNEKPDENTLYAIASNSKAFTASIIAQLVDEKKLSWEDRVQKHVPYFELADPWVSKEVTVRDALSHRVGLTTFGGDVIWYRSKLNGEEIVRRLKYLVPSYSFRSGYGYSNVMYITTGELIKSVTGKSWSENVKERFLTPLGMTRTISGTAELDKMGNYATPHIVSGGKNQAMPWEDWSHVAATGGILSSVKDMSQWMIFHLNNGVWNKDTLISLPAHNLMWTPHNNYNVDHTRSNRTGHFSGYGLGWTISDYHGKFRVGHTGGYSGMLSAVAMLPDEKLGVVVLTNGMKSIYSPLVNYTLDQFIKAPARDWSREGLQAEQDWSRKDTRISDREKARVLNTKPSFLPDQYAGEYFAPAYGKITVKNTGGKITIEFEHTPDLTATLEHWHYDTWKLNWNNPEKLAWFTFGTVKFNVDNNNKITGISFDVPNDDFWFEELNAVRKQH
jgi:CubicO group peptidase (beta-lactamase class C family)